MQSPIRNLYTPKENRGKETLAETWERSWSREETANSEGRLQSRPFPPPAGLEELECSLREQLLTLLLYFCFL